MIKKLTALLLLISAFAGHASTLTFTLTNYFSSPFTNTGVRVYPVSTPINVDGLFTITGLPIALNFDTNTGVATTNLMQGNYLLTNTSPLIRMLFAVPVSTNTYEVSQLAISGFNTYNYTPGVRTLTGTNGIVTSPANGMGDVIIDGNAFAPTAAMITNALGFFPLSPTQTTNVASNAVQSATNTLYGQLGTAAFSNSTAFYLRSNPSNYVSGSDVAGSNYLTASSLTTLATKTSLTNATNAIYVQLGTAAFTNSTNFYPRSNPSNFAQASITNNLASIGYALNLATNSTNFTLNIGLLSTNYSKTLGTNSTNYSATLSTNATNFTLSVGTATTNFVLSTSNALRSLNTGNFIANTNGTGYVSLTVDGTFLVYSNQFTRKTNFSNYEVVTNSLTVGGQITGNAVAAQNGSFDVISSGNFSGHKAIISNGSQELDESATTDTELGYVSGVTNAIQTQINAATALITTTSNGIRAQVISKTNGTAQTTLGVNGNLGVQTNITVGGFIQATNLSASRALVSDAAQRITNSVTTSTELAQLSGVTGNVQTNFNGKLQATNGTAQNLNVIGYVQAQQFYIANSTIDQVALIDEFGLITNAGVSSIEILNVAGSTGNFQTNINSRIPTINGRATNTLTLDGNLSVYTNAYLGSLTVTNAQTNQALTASAFVTTGDSKQLQSTAASSALALTLSDETGTGSVVFSNAPVITSPTFTTVTATDSLFNGTNAVAGDWAYVGTNMTSVVDGQNIVNPKTNVVLRITGTPTAAWTLSSIQGGRLNRVLQIINASGYTMTIANDSGFDSTAANRIYTGTGADVILTNSPGFASFTYDSISSRWVLNSVSGGVGTTETASNLGGGYPTYDNKTGVDLQFNTFTNGSGIQISSNAHLLTISITGTTLSNFNVGQFNTASDISIADGALVTNVVHYKTNVFKDTLTVSSNAFVTNTLTVLGTNNSQVLAVVGAATVGGTATFNTNVIGIGTNILSVLLATNEFRLPVSATPATATAGDIAFDNNAWASGRGAISLTDGTETNFVVATLATNTPSNGQVPTWTTGGKILWQTPSAGGGTAFNPNQFATNTSVVSFITAGVVTNLTAYGPTTNSGALNVTGNITNGTLTASRAVATDANKMLVSSATTATELGYVNGVTSAIQTQLDAKSYLYFSSTNDVFTTNAATSTEYVLTPATGRGTTNIVANTFSAGRNVEIDLYGDASDDGGTASTTYRVYLGSTVIATYAVAAPASTPQGWRIHISIVCNRSGATGIIRAPGYMNFNDGDGESAYSNGLINSVYSNNSFDTTAAYGVKVTTEFNASGTSKVISNYLTTIKAF